MINSNQLTVPCVGSVKSGDSVMIITRNGEPVAVAPIGWGDAVEADISDAATKATSYITDISSGGITVHPSDDSTTGVQITEDVDILRSGTSVINIGTDDAVRVGVETGKHADVTEDGFGIYDGDTQVGSFADGLVEIGSAPSSVDSNSTISMAGGTFNIVSELNMLGAGNSTTLSVPSSDTTYQYLYLKAGALAFANLRSLGLGGASATFGVKETASGAITAGLMAQSSAAGSTLSLLGDTITAESINGLKSYASGTTTAQNYFALINVATGVGVQFVFNPATLNLAVRYTTDGGTNWSSATRTIASWA